MSMELLIILAAARAPDVSHWNQSLAVAAVPAVIEEADLTRHTGFLPVTVSGTKGGFYFLLESFSELAAHYPALRHLKVASPVIYSLGYGARANECAAVFYSASVLVSKYGGTAFEPQGGVVMTEKDLLNAAKFCHGIDEHHK